jgi:hypothetical protein
MIPRKTMVHYADVLNRRLNVQQRKRLQQIIPEEIPVKRGETLVETISRLPAEEFHLVVQFTVEMLRKISDKDLRIVLRRYPTGDEAARSRWRRKLNKYGLKAKLKELVLSKDEHNRVLYLESERAKGNRLEKLNLILDQYAEIKNRYADVLKYSSIPELPNLHRELGIIHAQFEYAMKIGSNGKKGRNKKD